MELALVHPADSHVVGDFPSERRQIFTAMIDAASSEGE